MRYGHGVVNLPLPESVKPDWIVYPGSAEDGGSVPFGQKIHDALRHPIASAPLRSMVHGKTNAVILISDISRLCPSAEFLPALLEELNAGGIPDSRIQIVVALGMHRKQTTEELLQLVGQAVYDRVQVLNHSALQEDCVYVGETKLGTPVWINRTVAEAELRIATGNIEPHRLAGMSGGAKALVPGVAAHSTIEANHALSLRFAIQPGDPESPIRADMEEAQSLLPLHFLFNVVVDHERRIVEAVAGDPIAAHRAGADAARRLFFTEKPEPYDIVIASAGGHPKDMQLYQAVKTLQNAADLTKHGGRILLLVKCSELFGNGLFQYWVETGRDRASMAARLKESFVLGPHKIGHIDHVLQHHEVYLYSDIPAPLTELIGFRHVSDLNAALSELFAGPQAPRTAVMPYAALTFAGPPASLPAPQTHPTGVNRLELDALVP